jgi:phosphotransferase system IIB component
MSNKATVKKPISVNETEAKKPDMVNLIGKTTYQVFVHFNPNARENMSDKIKRMLRNEVSQAIK